MMENVKKLEEKAPHKYLFMTQKELLLDVMGLSTKKNQEKEELQLFI